MIEILQQIVTRLRTEEAVSVIGLDRLNAYPVLQAGNSKSWWERPDHNLMFDNQPSGIVEEALR